MGLLDDAIREHLELKRRRGADPGEVAHQTQEALGPIRREASSGDPSADAPASGQETVEINMDAVLEGDRQEWSDPRTVETDASEHSHVPEAGDGDSLEWEMPGDRAPAEGSGDSSGTDREEPDVLEETPDFLQETPEQERLWFEQRPPRDFHFDE